MWNPFKRNRGATDVGRGISIDSAAVEEEKPLAGLELIKKFTTATEPKVMDYPKGKYTGFWEIFLQDIPGGYSAMVRFYKYDTGLDQEFQFIKPNVAQLKLEVNQCILQTMPKYER